VSITGRILSAEEGEAAREFKAEGKIADNRAVIPMTTPKGSRIGKIELSFTQP
jgi:hypothetical protein